MRTEPRQCALIIAALFICSIRAHGGAWTQDAGHGQIIFTTSFFQTSSEFDTAGTSQRFDFNGKFRQLTLNPYFEYGISQRYTLVVNTNVPFLKYSNFYGSANSAGMGDVEVGIKRRLNSLESRWAVSGQLTTMFPGYPASRNPAPGNHQEDVEARFLVGRGATKAQRNLFCDMEAAYRYRSGAPADQVRADMTGGINFTRRFMAMAQVFAIKGLRNGDPFSTTNPNAQSDFDLYKAQASLVTSVGHGIRIQAGWNDAFSGRNTGRGHTVVLALWKSF